ncbi:MAG TPA: methylenetetrahydrofolate reductase [NAD(P)H] [Gammaproteobacteria bacterium]|nr:methylenetetrahydrofolate reductase [NAD(P)H] [Gammaproteobacteria bacterium]
MKSQAPYPKSYSFEFFPPKTETGREKLRQTYQQLGTLKPCYVSVTYGAGGSTRERTFQAVSDIKEGGLPVAPHLSCVGATRQTLREILNHYKSQNIRHIIALRGDLPSGSHQVGELRYANELVSFIREESGDHFFVEVAAYPEFHPQAPSAEADLKNFKRKVDAGADAAITQYFYNPDAYFRFVESCEKMGLELPVTPGIMPITNYQQLARFSDACGAEIPRWLRWRLQDYGDDIQSLRAFGLDVTTKLCADLLEGGAPGLHFYTMNQAGPTMAIWERLGLKSSPTK